MDTIIDEWTDHFIVNHTPFEDATEEQLNSHKRLQTLLGVYDGAAGMIFSDDHAEVQKDFGYTLERAKFLRYIGELFEMEWATEGKCHEYVSYQYMREHRDHTIRFTQMFLVFLERIRESNTWMKRENVRLQQENAYD